MKSPIASLIVFALFYSSFVPTVAFAQNEPILLPEPDVVHPPVVRKSDIYVSKYDDGSVKMERGVNIMSDDTFVNQGTNIEYYPNGKKFVEGRYDKGIKEGEWTYWHENGEVCKKITFKAGLPDGTFDVFREDKSKESTHSYSDGKRNGKWTQYGDDGETILAVEEYSNGKRTGTWNYWFPNGKMKSEVNFKDGKQDGMTKVWNEEGKPLQEIHFKDGLQDGKSTIWSSEGKPTVYEYKAGKRIVE